MALRSSDKQYLDAWGLQNENRTVKGETEENDGKMVDRQCQKYSHVELAMQRMEKK